MPRKKEIPDESGLTFNEGLHEYRYNNIVVPSVTQIISTYMAMDMSFIPERYRDRGTAVHKAIELHVNNELDETSVMSELQPYVRGFKLFQKDYQWTVSFPEMKLYHEELAFAGTVDQVGTFGAKTQRCILDIKTGRKAKQYRLQTAGYSMLYSPKTPVPRYMLYLDAEGDYELDEHTDGNDYTAFQLLLGSRKVNFEYGGRLR